MKSVQGMVGSSFIFVTWSKCYLFLSLSYGRRIRGVGNYNTTVDMANVERLESCLRSAPHALVPYLDPNLLAIDFQYFETKVIGVFIDRM